MTAAPDPVAAALPPIERPNGKLYRPRKLIAHALSENEGDVANGVLVTGTHDLERALPLARELVRQECGTGYEPAYSGGGWWRDGMANGRQCWVDDDERGAAGVLFGRIEETEGTAP